MEKNLIKGFNHHENLKFQMVTKNIYIYFK